MKIRALCSLLIIFAIPAYPHTTETTTFISPCPSIFTYEPSVYQYNMTKEAKWYGVVTLTTETTLYALWLNIVVDNEADILGNWVGEVSTEDNLDFKIENTKLKISPDQPLDVRFFVQFKPSKKIPKLQAIRFNGRQICSTDNPERLVETFTVTPVIKTTLHYTTTVKSTPRTLATTQKTTSRPQYWAQTKADNTAHVYSYASSNMQHQLNQKSDKNENTTTKSPWSYTRTVSNQQTESQDKQKSKLGEKQTATDKQHTKLLETTTSKSQFHQTGNKNYSPARTENYLHTTSTARSTSQAWHSVINTKQVLSENNQVQSSIRQYYQEHKVQNTKSDNKQDTITESDPFRQQATSSFTGFGSLSNTNTKTSYEARPNVKNPGYQFETPQTIPKLSQESIPIYTRPEAKPHTLANDRLQGRPKGSSIVDYSQTTSEKTQVNKHESNTHGNDNKESLYFDDWTSDWSEGNKKLSKDRESLFGSIGALSYNEEEIKDTRNVDVSGIIYNPYYLTTSKTSTTTTEEPEPSEDDYFPGPPTIFIPNHSPGATSCGKVYFKKHSYSQRGTSMEGQWPWQIALYQQQKSTVDFKYICGGTLVSRLHVITAAHCVTRKKTARVVNKVTLTVYLGKTNLRTSVDGVQIKSVNKIIVHPAYNGSTFARDLAILELREPITFSDWVQPACLWPEDEVSLKNVIGKRGSVVGWGFDVTGVAKEELSLLEMPVVDQQTCIDSYIDFYRKFTSDYTYCAGYKDGTTVCNGDSGGGMVFKRGNSFHLRGVASLSVARENKYGCDPNRYVIFTDVAKFLPWIQDQIEDY